MGASKKPPDKLWFPSLLQVANNIDTNSWFNILQKSNPNETDSRTEIIENTYLLYD